MNPLRRNPKELNMFLIASLINTTGGSLMWPLVSMYVFDELGRSLADAGLAILAQSLGGIIGQLLGGALYHRVGVKRLVTGSLALNASILLLLPLLSGNWRLFIGAMWLIGLFNSMSLPAIQSYIGFRFTERRAEIFNIIYVANNIGVALGTALSGFLADFSYHLSFIANGATSAFFAVFFLFYLKSTVVSHGAATSGSVHGGRAESPGAWALLGNVRLYLLLASGALLLHIGNSIWNTGVSPFIVGAGMAKRYYGFLWTLNGVLIFAAQPLLGLIKRYLTRTVSAQMTASSLFYAAGYACILLIQSYPGMVLGMVLATLGEMLISPAVPAYLSEHGGAHAPFYIGLAGGIGSGGRVIGPYVMGSLYDAGGLPPVAWLALGAALLSAGAYWAHSAWNRQAAVKRVLPGGAAGEPHVSA
ncbi:MFS transporter [Paenibacillus sp. YN15]|uniref:MFS transporter n=1 Tax=Paenibacillus sp. YN15 TaxID=1742774 RepID=UPI000DCB3996|nr:MFS transporter [Paenibacillus sp. YN15]RAU97900.1 MFS transporter [Paenibacillus sp. YN15]